MQKDKWQKQKDSIAMKEYKERKKFKKMPKMCADRSNY